MTSVLVTGGTGTLGSHLVPLLSAAGHDVRVLSRSGKAPAAGATSVVGDLLSGSGVADALADVSTVVHLAGDGGKGDAAMTRTLVRAAGAADLAHLVNISVVGADRVPMRSAVDRSLFGYWDQKRQGELAVSGSGLPWTTLRAAQFHEFVVQTVDGYGRSPFAPVFAGTDFQPVAAREVAERLVELVDGDPSGLVPELAGPEPIAMRDLARSYLHVVGRRRVVLPLWLPGAAARAMRDGAGVLTGDGVTGRQTWPEFLAETYA